MIESYPTEIECYDDEIDVKYFRIKMFDAESAEIKSEVLIGSREELEEYLENIRSSYLKMFPKWDEAELI